MVAADVLTFDGDLDDDIAFPAVELLDRVVELLAIEMVTRRAANDGLRRTDSRLSSGGLVEKATVLNA